MTDTTIGRSRVRPLLRRALAAESAMWRSLFRWMLRRRRPLDDGAREFGYAGVVTPLFVVFIVVSAVEIPLLDLLLGHFVPWPPVRIIALVLGAWGLIWMFGMLAAVRVHPHVVGPAGLRIRNGHSVDVTIPWQNVATIGGRMRSLTSSSRVVEFERTDTATHVYVGTGGQTNVDIVFREPAILALPKGPSEPVTGLRFYADTSDALIAYAREQLTAAR